MESAAATMAKKQARWKRCRGHITVCDVWGPSEGEPATETTTAARLPASGERQGEGRRVGEEGWEGMYVR